MDIFTPIVSLIMDIFTPKDLIVPNHTKWVSPIDYMYTWFASKWLKSKNLPGFMQISKLYFHLKSTKIL